MKNWNRMQAHNAPGIQNLPLQRCVQQGLDSKTSNFCWKTTGMRYPTAPRAFENFTLDASDTPEGSHFKHSTKNTQYTVLENWFFTATYHNLKLFSFFIFGIYK